MTKSNFPQEQDWSAEPRRIETRLNLCRSHCDVPRWGPWLGISVVTLGVGVIVLGIAFVVNRATKLSTAEVREPLCKLKSPQDREFGVALCRRRDGHVYTGDLTALIRHLEEQSKQLLRRDGLQITRANRATA